MENHNNLKIGDEVWVYWPEYDYWAGGEGDECFVVGFTKTRIKVRLTNRGDDIENGGMVGNYLRKNVKTDDELTEFFKTEK
tara:strand:+ start:732 stop:974 length:243 start_codon:yes stop_codon:yes gene_type:complete